MMRLALLLAFAAVVSTAGAAEKLPTFPKRTSYEQARQSLIAMEWSPVKQTATRCEGSDCGLARCLPGDERCSAFPEAEICRGTGAAACDFVWRRKDTIIEIRAIGEEQQVVDRVRCRAGCR